MVVRILHLGNYFDGVVPLLTGFAMSTTNCRTTCRNIEKNQSFNEFPIDGIPIVFQFASPLEKKCIILY